MQESDKILLFKSLKVVAIVWIALFFTVVTISWVAICSMYKQSLKVLEQDTEKWRIYFETDYDYIEYPNIDMSQRIGDEKQ